MADNGQRGRPPRGPRGMANQRGRGGGKNKKRDMGRAEWSRNRVDRRARNNEEQASKRRKTESGEGQLPIYATQFTEEEIAAEERRPKKKVAVLIGYSGSGYKGMQLTHDQKTIEGDLFQAFVAAGAISKANATDPKKSAFVRCARTDKGVHAAGNVISLKLIVEDPDVVEKINQSLSPQIRVWGIERTNQSFSAYQLCDSRVYEYLIPSHGFLPPHPNSFLGKKLVEIAEEAGDIEGLRKRQEEVTSFWLDVERTTIKPLFASYDAQTREILEKALFSTEKIHFSPGNQATDDAAAHANDNGRINQDQPKDDMTLRSVGGNQVTAVAEKEVQKPSVIADAVKILRNAYLTAKRAYRISPERVKRIQEAFELYRGTHSFHNYTFDKKFGDPSAQRIIKSFVVNPNPIIINGTEWLSLKVHGQSFMMHQIRKMVGMVALVIRCGCDPQRIVESYGKVRLSIPKAPGLGLLLERPVFNTYNNKAVKDFDKQPLDFDKYEKEIEDFKQREIYERIYREEESDNVFGNFFNHIDNFLESTFLFVTSRGAEATKATTTEPQQGEKEGKALPETIDSDPDEKADGQGGEG